MNIIPRKANANALRQVENLDILLFEGEIAAHQFVIEPTDGVSFTGAQIVGIFLRADNQRVEVENGTVTGGNAVITLTASCYAVPGRFKWTVYAVTASETVCIYAAAGTVYSTRGTEEAGDTEPIVEPDTGNVADLQTAIEFLHGLNHGTDGSVTVNGVTITRKGFVYTLNGTATATIYVHLNGKALEADSQDKTNEWSTAASNISDIPNGRYYLQGYNMTTPGVGIGMLSGKGWSSIEDSVGRTLDSYYLGPAYATVLLIDNGMTFNNVKWMLTTEPMAS